MKNQKMQANFYLIMLIFGILGMGLLSIVFPLGSIIPSNITTPKQANTPLGNYSYQVVQAFPELTFDAPVGLLHPPEDASRMFVVDQTGQIFHFANNPNVTEKVLFLDVSEKIIYGGELGLLSMVFHPNYAENGLVYVYYNIETDAIYSKFIEYTVPDPATFLVDENSAREFLSVEQPYSNHNGGPMIFGPDGYLYIGLGDGGSGGDPKNNSQNLHSLLGKLLRIDVNVRDPYGIPATNPFYDSAENYREEIFAYGLRNPWRFSFDNETGKIWLADVGQNKWEEINVIKKGGNYGWNYREGFHEYEGGNTTILEDPIYEYGHSLGSSITGGYVYRGTRYEGIRGKYIYGDYTSGRIWALNFSSHNDEVQANDNVELLDSDLAIPSFALDFVGNLYILAFDGYIYQLQEHLNGTTPNNDQSRPVISSFPFEWMAGISVLSVIFLFKHKFERKSTFD